MIKVNLNLRLAFLCMITSFGYISCADGGVIEAFESSRTSALSKHGSDAICRDLFEVAPASAPSINDLSTRVSVATGGRDVDPSPTNAIKQGAILEAVVFSAVYHLNRFVADDRMSLWVVARFTSFLNRCGFVEPVRPWFSRVSGAGDNPSQYLFGDGGLMTSAITTIISNTALNATQSRLMSMFRNAAREFPNALFKTRLVEISRIDSDISASYFHQSTSAPLNIFETTMLVQESRELGRAQSAIIRFKRFIESIPCIVKCFCCCCMPKLEDDEYTPLASSSINGYSSIQ